MADLMNRKNLLRITTYIILTYFIVGCTGYQYVSSPVYVPVNKEKGDLKLDLSYDNIQVGYAFTNHLSLFATGFIRSNKGGSKGETFLGKENSGAKIRSDSLMEANFGFSIYGKTEAFYYEFLLGSGIGRVKYNNRINDYDNDYQFRMVTRKFNLFVQPTIGFKIKNVIELGAFSKFIYASYYDIKSNVILGNSQDETDKHFIGKKQADLFFVEPGVFFRVGSKNIKFQTQLSPSINLLDNKLNYRQYNVYLSLFINVNIFSSSEKITK